MSVATRTGEFPIGFRRGWTDWQKDIEALLAFAKAENFACIDLGADALEDGKAIIDAGLTIGSVDLPGWKELLSPDASERKAAIAKAQSHIEAWKSFGPMNHFVVMLPKDPGLKKQENFAFMVESFSALAPALESAAAKIVIEGWPGAGALCCTPESLRAFFAECASPAMGINYDPSHLIRMGIDPIRFLAEFVGRVFHTHGKDTELYTENLYETGWEVSADHLDNHGFGRFAWRYTIPGHGMMRWVTAFGILHAAGYQGAVSIELEDKHFNGSDEGERDGFVHSRNFLQSC